jgi:aryl-alcohol dehydrogenase-like predicted oxidoreductase
MKALLERPLGTSGLRITQVGFGAWAIGGGGWTYGWGSQDDADSIAAIRHAIACGINWVDTAAIYGLGHSEEMSRLIDEGKVRAGGVSNFDVGLLEQAERIRHVDSLQPPLSLIRRQSAADVIPWCASSGTGVIVYSPMQSGILTDDFSRERVERMASDDWRRRSAEFQEPRLSRNLMLRNALRPVAARHEVSVAAVAVAWTLSWRGVSGAIVGARSPEQVDGWVAAGSLILDPSDLAEIAEALERTQAGAGPTGRNG